MSLSPWPSMRKGQLDTATSPIQAPNHHLSTASNKLPFFEKYAKVYGGSNTSAPSSQHASPISPRPQNTQFTSNQTIPVSSSDSSIATYSSNGRSSPDTSPDSSEVSSNLSHILATSKGLSASAGSKTGFKPASNLSSSRRGISPSRATPGFTSAPANLSKMSIKMAKRPELYDVGAMKASPSEPVSLNLRMAGIKPKMHQHKKSTSPNGSVAQLDDLLDGFDLSPQRPRIDTSTARDDDAFDVSSYLSRPESSDSYSHTTPKLPSSSSFASINENYYTPQAGPRLTRAHPTRAPSNQTTLLHAF